MVGLVLTEELEGALAPLQGRRMEVLLLLVHTALVVLQIILQTVVVEEARCVLISPVH